jgi:RimJ/RimL family protein N-acetyltransferase
MAPTPEQACVIAGLKSGLPRAMSIPILSAQASVAGSLVPMTYRLAEDPVVVDALFRWRRSHMTAFLTVFIPTLEKTRNYLTAFSLPDGARILFLIADRESRYVGHIGLCNIAADGAEIDNVIRGEPVDGPDFMVCAHNALLGWAFASLDIPLAYLNVLAHNERAIRTYRKVGFRAVSRTPLVREEQGGGYRLRPAFPSNGGSAEAALVRMEIPREALYRGQSRSNP